MSDIRREDLWKLVDQDGWTKDEFHSIATSLGYVKVTEPCETCGGNSPTQAESIDAAGEIIQQWCTDCDGSGKTLRDGVYNVSEWSLEMLSGTGGFVLFPASWLEATDA